MGELLHHRKLVFKHQLVPKFAVVGETVTWCTRIRCIGYFVWVGACFKMSKYYKGGSSS